MKKYNYKNESYIQTFVDDSATQLINHLFKNVDGSDKNTQMVGVKNIIQDIRKVNPKHFEESFRMINIDSMYRKNLWNNDYQYDSITSTNMIVNLNDRSSIIYNKWTGNHCVFSHLKRMRNDTRFTDEINSCNVDNNGKIQFP